MEQRGHRIDAVLITVTRHASSVRLRYSVMTQVFAFPALWEVDQESMKGSECRASWLAIVKRSKATPILAFSENLTKRHYSVSQALP
jgi:hypothetical protein